MNEKVKLKGHESFSIREGWLTKGINEVKNNSKIFSEKNATDILGLGSNMVKSLKYWLITANLIKEDKKCNYILTEFGELIYKYDLYMEDIFTMYMIHLQIVTNEEKALIWNLFFNKCKLKEFNKKDLLEQMEYILNVDNKEYNSNLLPDEISTVLKTYTIEEKNTDPENNFTCPLSELKLLKKIGRDQYQKLNSDIENTDMYIVYFAILSQCQDRNSISIDDLANSNNSVGKLLNLNKNLLNEYLEILKREKLITVNRTAGLNMVYINKRYSLNEIFELYFGKEK